MPLPLLYLSHQKDILILRVIRITHMTTLWHSQVVNSTVTMRENPSPDGASIIIYIYPRVI